MRLPILLAAAALCLPAAAAAKAGYTKGVANAALVAAAKATPLKAIDYGEDLCQSGRTVERWLTQLAGVEPKAIVWTGGPCELVSEGGIDSGSSWCVQANLQLKHPLSRKDSPMIEVFFEKPVRGRPGKAYAFRGVVPDRNGDIEIIRFRRDFEAAWSERFPATAFVVRCPGDETR